MRPPPRLPGQPLLLVTDRQCLEWVERAWRQHEQTLLSVDWTSALQAGQATVLTAILRFDLVPAPDAILAWWNTPISVLLGRSWTRECPRLDPVTGWCIEAIGRGIPCPGEHLPGEAATLVGLVESGLKQLAPPGTGTVWTRTAAALQRLAVVHLPPALRTGLAQGTPMAPHSRWRCDVGAVPPEGRAWAAGATTPVSELRAVTPPSVAAQLLADLATRLRGQDIADVGHHARKSFVQGAALIESFQRGHAWGAFETLVLQWSHRHLLENSGDVRPQSIARYLSALIPVVRAQGDTPFLIRDPSSGQCYLDHDRWAEVAGTLVGNKRDEMTIETLARLFHAMREPVPVLRDLDLSVLEGHGRSANVAAHLVSPSEFDAAMTGLYEAGGEYARGALAAALMFHMGLRPSEALGLLGRHVLDEGDGVLLVWSHPARRLKTRPRRIRLQGCLPEPWRTRLLERAAAAREVDARCGYLLADLRRPTLAPADSLLQPAVMRLRLVTGDGKLSAHSLRHSFATFVVMRMALMRTPDLGAYPCRLLDEAVFSPGQVQAWCRAWFGATVPHDGLYALAQVLGHSGPERALTSYIHVSDLLVRAHLTRALPTPGRRVVAALLGLGMAQLHRLEKRARERLRRERLVADFPTCWAIANELAGRCAPGHAPPPVPKVECRDLRLADLPQVCAVLPGWERPLASLADLFACPVQGLERMLENARQAQRWPEFPGARSRELLTSLLCAVEPLLASPQAGQALIAWRQGRCLSRLRRVWPSPDALLRMAPLLAPLANQDPRQVSFRVFLVSTSASLEEDRVLLRTHQRLTGRLQRMGDKALAPRICTWRDLRCPPRGADSAPAAAGPHLVIVPGVPSRGRALGSGQALLSVLDAAALLHVEPGVPQRR